MNVGMLWYYGDSEGTLAERLDEAVSYYREKYGQMPTHGVLHESVSAEDLPDVKGMQFRNGAVQRDHVRIGTQRSGGAE